MVRYLAAMYCISVCGYQDWVQIRICIPKFGVFVFALKISKRRAFVFDVWSVFEKVFCIHNQIHIKITILPTKGQALPDTNWLRNLDRMFFMRVVWSTVDRQQTKLAYS